MLGSSGLRYLRFFVSPACTDGLTVRKALQDALLQSFGLTSANIYVDILWLAENGAEVVVRVNTSEATKLMAAVTASAGSPKLSLIKDSAFLPALLSTASMP